MAHRDDDDGPDLISINAGDEEIVSADHADLVVTVDGSSLVTGRAALKKAKEVSALVEALERSGVSLDDIHLEAVQAEVSSGLLGSSSSATMGVEVRIQYRIEGFAHPTSGS